MTFWKDAPTRRDGTCNGIILLLPGGMVREAGAGLQCRGDGTIMCIFTWALGKRDADDAGDDLIETFRVGEKCAGV